MRQSRRTLQDRIANGAWGRTNLRNKITIANMTIAFLVVLIMGIYLYLRIQDASQQLVNTVENNVRSQSAEELYNANREQAAFLDSFFNNMSQNTAIAGNSIQSILGSKDLASDTVWNAATALTQLSTGGWDNANTEIPSIFMPAGTSLTPARIAKLNLLKHSELVFPSILEGSPDIVAVYFGGKDKELFYYPNVDLANIVPPDFDVTGRQWYLVAISKNNPENLIVWSPPYEDAALNGLVLTTSVPVYDEKQRFQGVVGMDVQITRVITLVAGTKIGDTGYAFLVDNNNRVIALPENGYRDFGITDENAKLSEIMDPATLSGALPEFYEILGKVTQEQEGLFTADVNGVERSIAFHSIPEVNYKLVFILPTQELFKDRDAIAAQIKAETNTTVALSGFLIAAVFILAIAASFAVSNRLTKPLGELNDTAKEIINGNFDAKASVHSGDEIETLGVTLNTMTDTVKGLVSSLENRVSERTLELQQVVLDGERRGKQYEAIAKVAQAISSQKNLSELLPQIADVISEQFGFYHVGIFLNDPTNSYAMLAAANSEGGKRMLDRRHQLKVGAQGIVGYATGTKKPRIALSVGEDAVYFNNPDLPETQSEMALPLIEGDVVLGALDVQSTESNAFSDKDLDALSILAELVSIAIQNARLYEKMDRSLAEAEAASRQYFRENWNRLAEESKVPGYRYTASGAAALTGTETLGENVPNRKQITVPITIRGEEIGELSIAMPKDGNIKSDQMDMIRAVADRVAVIAENARLFDETTRRAERERLVTDITTKIRTTNDPQAMIETAISELREALKVSRIEIVPQKKQSPDR
ncbi:hypothetical protein MASR2M66_08190 [Chloroflexota bacterium]